MAIVNSLIGLTACKWKNKDVEKFMIPNSSQVTGRRSMDR
jgi:hypothetical protein